MDRLFIALDLRLPSLAMAVIDVLPQWNFARPEVHVFKKPAQLDLARGHTSRAARYAVLLAPPAAAGK